MSFQIDAFIVAPEELLERRITYLTRMYETGEAAIEQMVSDLAEARSTNATIFETRERYLATAKRLAATREIEED